MMKPLYTQIAEDISRLIASGELKPGDLIPSEAQLAMSYSASKMTVRQGLAQLYEAGYLQRIPGKGNYVAQPRYDVFTMYFNEMAITKGDPERINLIDVTIINPDAEVRQKLSLKQGAKVILMKRLLSNIDGPVAMDIKYIPYDKGSPVVEEEIQNIPFPEMVADGSELFSMKNDVTVYAASASEEVALRLQIALNSPLLVIEQQLISGERAVGWGKTYCRSEFFQLHAISAQYQNIKNRMTNHTNLP
jgi:GntR family transcriptional regulator